jgi:hypothetical protein
MRYEYFRESDWRSRAETSIDALAELGDVNFADGMCMLLKVYPDILPFSYGGEHLEILLRPIPRALWPDKPVGSWTQKLAQRRGYTFSTGISPSVYGSFYAEAGLLGILFFSALYGWGTARMSVYFDRYQSLLNSILKGALVASLFAVLRGGDLAGTFAFAVMTFWPLVIFLFSYNRYLQAVLQPAPARFGNRFPREFRHVAK